MVRNIPYKNIENLIEDFYNAYKEDSLFKELKHIKTKGYLTKKEFLAIGMWKSPRPRRYYEKNTSEDVKKISSKAFSLISEIQKIKTLMELEGVRIPTASAILALSDPKKYGVIDIRVWQTLYYFGIVNTNKGGINFSIENWLDLTLILRNLAEKLNSTPRSIERALFEAHKKYQFGTLYQKSTKQ